MAITPVKPFEVPSSKGQNRRLLDFLLDRTPILSLEGVPLPHFCSGLWCTFFSPAGWNGLEKRVEALSEHE